MDKDFIARCNQFAKDEWKNIDKNRLYSKKWRINNKESQKNSLLKYSQSEKGKIAIKKRDENRKIRFLESCSNLDEYEFNLIKRFYLNCPYGYEVDHIVPISKGGKHSIENLQYLPKEENRRKSCSLDWESSSKQGQMFSIKFHKEIKELNITSLKSATKKRRIIRSL